METLLSRGWIRKRLKLFSTMYSRRKQIEIKEKIQIKSNQIPQAWKLGFF